MNEQSIQRDKEDQQYHEWLRSLKPGDRVVCRCYYHGYQDIPDWIEAVREIAGEQITLEYGTTLNAEGKSSRPEERNESTAHVEIVPLTPEIEEAVHHRELANLIDDFKVEAWSSCPVDFLEHVLWNVTQYQTNGRFREISVQSKKEKSNEAHVPVSSQNNSR